MIPTSESGWSYNGPFSNTEEFHASIYGIAAGILVAVSEPIREEIPNQIHYFIGFGILTYVYLRKR